MNNRILTPEKQIEIIYQALKDHFREVNERKKVPSDYLLLFTEGGEADAIACAIAEKEHELTAQQVRAETLKEAGKWLEKISVYQTESGYLVSNDFLATLKSGKLPE